MEADQVGIQQTLQELLSLVETLKDARGWEGLVEIETDVSPVFLSLEAPDMVRHEHELITMNPDCLRIYQRTHLMHAFCNCLIDSFELFPVMDQALLVIIRVDEVVHVRPD